MNIGERVGDYEIVQILGAGGMGQVYKVRNVLSDRIEAMKILLPNLEGDPGLADRFLNEIKVQATLDHPNIAKLHTAMRTGNQLVMVMEFVDGRSLSEVLQSGPLAPGTAAAYAAEVLDALGYAHAHGVIHRDIKPANIMLARNGQIKLMDFGIARVQANRHLTQTGSTVGSLFYMSPEQIKGNDPDGRSDLYSLGITMYEMVTGRRPFLGDSDFQIMSAHLQQAPMAPIEVIPGIPTAMSDIILMAIEKDPAARFQSAEAFRAALASAFPAAVTPTRTMLPVAVPALVVPPMATAPVAASAFPAMTPPPLPNATPPTPADAPWMVPAAPARSRRGLYMALGSVLTLAVLVAAVIEGPKLMHGGAADAQGVPASAGVAATAAAPAVTAAPTVATPAAATAPATATPTAAPAGAPESTAPAAASAAAPVEPPRPIQQPVPAQYAFRPAQPPRQSARAAQGAIAQPSTIAQAMPAAQPVPAVQSPPANAAPPVTAATASPELKELRDRINRVAVRAAAAQAGVRSIEEGVERQGLGLRGDIKAASIRLDYVLQEARASLQNGDVEGARNNLQYAEGTLQKIEKFLGQ
jgi:eukaryotic-like serine/threonine-protein kinase